MPVKMSSSLGVQAVLRKPISGPRLLAALAPFIDDRAELGAELDRRIRARVLEVWNEERPG